MENNEKKIAEEIAGDRKDEFGNTNSKEIWRNRKLCAQFLRNYSGVSLFENVQPEDIEEITEKLRPFVGVEYEGDSVMRVRIHKKSEEIYVVGLLEHKSEVDYDVGFQLLKYMVGIWDMYRNQFNKKKKNSSALKVFRYPLIVPIVYFEGKGAWTADMHWKDRVEFSEEFGQYVPDFTYKVMRLHDYTREELLSKEEELTLVMLLNRVQTEQDLDFSKWTEAQRSIVEKIVRMAPDDILHILVQMTYHLGLKLKLSDDKLIHYVKNVEDRDMGELWAHMDEINIPEIKRNLQIQFDKAMAEVQAEKEKVQAEKAEVQAEKAEVQAEKAEVQAEKAEVQAEKAEVQAEKAEVQAEKVEVQAEKENWQKYITDQEQKIADLQAEIERLKSQKKS